jgi:WD domain, G-beta repeat
MLHRCFALFVILGLSAVALAQDSAKFAGTWKSKAKVSGFDQIMTIANDDGKWSVKGTYQKEGEEAGEYVGEDVKLTGGKLVFSYKVTKQPAPKGDKGRVTVQFEGAGLRYTFTSGNTTAGRHFARVGEEPKVVAKDAPKTPTPAPESGDPEKQYAGIWTGAYPGTSYRLILNIMKEEKWVVEGFLTSAEGKRLGYFKHETAAMTKQKTITSVALWEEKPKDVKGGSFTLSARPPMLQLEFKAAKGKAPLTAELKRGEKEVLAQLKPPERSEPKGIDDLKPKPNTPAGEPGVMNTGSLIMGMGFLDEGKTLAVGLGNGKLQYWDVGKRELTRTEGAYEAAGPFAVAPNGKFLIRTYAKVTGGSGQGMVEILDPVTAKQLNLFEAHPTGIRSMMISLDSRLVVSCCGEPLDKNRGAATVRLWEAETGKVVATQNVSADSVAISPQSDRFLYATLKGEFDARVLIVNLCDTKGKLLAAIQTPHKQNILHCAFSPDGNTLATVSNDGMLVLSDLASRKPLKSVQLVLPGQKLNYRLNAVVFSPDGKLVIVGQDNGYVFYRDAKTAAEVKSERPFQQSVDHLVFSPADGRLMIAAGNGRIVLRDLPAAP